MEIKKDLLGSKLVVEIIGRLDTNTAPQLSSEIENDITSITDLVFDFAKLDYISSAGLRILLMLQKTMAPKGTFVIKSVNAEIMDVLDMTGFSDILTIEK